MDTLAMADINICCAIRYDMYRDIEQVLAEKRGTSFEGKFVRGLPMGLELPGGVIVGQ